MFLEIYTREQDVHGSIHFVVCVFHGWVWEIARPQ
jgi:hypothetical protein